MKEQQTVVLRDPLLVGFPRLAGTRAGAISTRAERAKRSFMRVHPWPVCDGHGDGRGQDRLLALGQSVQ